MSNFNFKEVFYRKLIEYSIYIIFLGISSLFVLNFKIYYFITNDYPNEMKIINDKISSKYEFLNNKINYVDSINKYRYYYLEKIIKYNDK